VVEYLRVFSHVGFFAFGGAAHSTTRTSRGMTILLRRKLRRERLAQRQGLLVAGLTVGWQAQESLVPDARAGLTPRDMVEQKLLALRWGEQPGFRTATAAQSEDGRSKHNGSSRPIDAEFEGRQRDKLLPLDPAPLHNNSTRKRSSS
jgi:hypothetical protein